MKIAMVGNFTQPHCSEVHWAATLEDLDCSVSRIQENNLQPGTLASKVYGHDFLLWVKTWEGFVTRNDLDQLKSLNVPTVSLHLDAFVGLNREANLDNSMFWRTDVVFSADGDPRTEEVFKSKGINHKYLPPGVYKPECVLGTPQDKYRQDIIFIGGGIHYHPLDWPYRMQLLNHLSATYGSRYTKWGYPEPTIRNQELNDLYASVKVAVGDSLNIGFKHENYTSDRLFESVGRGAFTIYPRIKGIEDMLVENKEIVYYDYGNFKELDEKINYYLEHDGEREAIRKAGFERVKKDHTYHNRMQSLLKTLEHEGVLHV